MQKLCYNCGKPLSKQDETVEHIPAKCFFVGYGDDYKKNRITVPACNECNNAYSKIDQELRDAIGIMTDNHTDKSELVSKSVRSILRQKDGVKRILSKDGSIYIEFSYNKLREIHIKNFKGIYYHKFGKPLPEKYQNEIITEGDQSEVSYEKLAALYNYLDNYKKEWSHSGNPNIFKYKMVGFNNNNRFEEINEDTEFILAKMIYHEEIICFVFGATKRIIEKFKK